MQLVRCCHRRGSGRFPRHASESRARSAALVAAAQRLTKKRHSLPHLSRAPPASDRAPVPLSPLLLSSVGLRAATTDAHTISRVRSLARSLARLLARARVVGDSVRQSPPPRIERDSTRIHAAPGERVIGSRTPSTCPRTFTAAYPRNPPPSPSSLLSEERSFSLKSNR